MSIYRRPSPSARGADSKPMTANALRAFSGSCGLEPLGASCPAGMAAPAAAGEGSRSGKSLACCLSCGGHSWPSSTTNRKSAGMSALPTAASPRPKRGQDQQGHEGAGSGRWRGYSAGSILGLGVLGGSHAFGEDTRYGGGKASGQARTVPQAPRPVDGRSRFGQQPPAPAAEAAGDRADHPRTAQPPECHPSGWAEVAPLPAAVDRGANLCLTWAFSAPGGAL